MEDLQKNDTLSYILRRQESFTEQLREIGVTMAKDNESLRGDIRVLAKTMEQHGTALEAYRNDTDNRFREIQKDTNKRFLELQKDYVDAFNGLREQLEKNEAEQKATDAKTKIDYALFIRDKGIPAAIGFICSMIASTLRK